MNIGELSTADLRRVLAIKEQIEALQNQIAALVGEAPDSLEPATPKPARRKYTLTAAHRAKLVAALAKARAARSAKARAAKAA
jgi:hypothetical protein